MEISATEQVYMPVEVWKRLPPALLSFFCISYSLRWEKTGGVDSGSPLENFWMSRAQTESYAIWEEKWAWLYKWQDVVWEMRSNDIWCRRGCFATGLMCQDLSHDLHPLTVHSTNTWEREGDRASERPPHHEKWYLQVFTQHSVGTAVTLVR